MFVLHSLVTGTLSVGHPPHDWNSSAAAWSQLQMTVAERIFFPHLQKRLKGGSLADLWLVERTAGAANAWLFGFVFKLVAFFFFFLNLAF